MKRSTQIRPSSLRARVYRALLISLTALSCAQLWAHPLRLHKGDLRSQDPFRQLEELWPTPTEVRTASGRPGPAYWQQQVDYDIDVRIDDQRQRVEGRAQITYHNRSPHELGYLWLQLDQNRFAHDSLAQRSKSFKSVKELSYEELRQRLSLQGKLPGQAEREGGHQIKWVRDSQGHDLPFTIVDTMMRVDLPSPLSPQATLKFSLEWAYQVQEVKRVWARGGYEELKSAEERDRLIADGLKKLAGEKKDKDQDKGKAKDQAEKGDRAETETAKSEKKKIKSETESPKAEEAEAKAEAPALPARRVYELAQWFPRLAAYTDVNGWQNKAFLGNGEFTLEFGDYKVRVTAPDTFTVTATGVLQNPQEVLSDTQQARLKLAESSDRPVMITTAEEAKERELMPATGEKTWVFHAEQVRDFAFAASSTFLWDAWGYQGEAGLVMAMSLYPLEGEPLWSRYSTQAIVHTLEVYERFTFPYPYPVAISVNGPVGGMEYPMICFNGPRPEPDGTYTKWSKYGLISVVIHEVGHFFFPMIVNSDERQWTWLDEGINTFLEFQAEREWEPDYPYWRGEPSQIVQYMSSSDQVPIMTNSESILQFGNNAYAKPATALSVLRESVIGPELFDVAFKEYARAWRFKRPQPSDFFRTMEDVSGVDLDWFWRGWFYSTLPVDVAVTQVKRYRLSDKDPERDQAEARAEEERRPKSLIKRRDEGKKTRVDRFPELVDYYTTRDRFEVTKKQREAHKKVAEKREEWKREIHERGGLYYDVTLKNVGGLISFVPLLLRFESGAEELRVLPAELWRKHPEEVKLLIHVDEPLIGVELDPRLETADINRENNYFPQRIDQGSFTVGSWRDKPRENPMRDALIAEREAKEELAKTEAKEREPKQGEPKQGEPKQGEPKQGEAEAEGTGGEP